MMTLKAARVNKNLTQEKAAELIGVTNDTISRWESGKTFPSVPQITKIEEVYGVGYNEIDFFPEKSSVSMD